MGRHRGKAFIAVLAQDSGAQMQVAGLVIKQQDAHGLDVRIGHPVNDARYAVWRLNHCLPPYNASLRDYSHHLVVILVSILYREVAQEVD